MDMSLQSCVAKMLETYVQPPDFSALKQDIGQRTYGLFRWKILKNLNDPETDDRFSSIWRIMFICEQSVIIQQTELSVGESRFLTYRVMLNDWGKVFINWGPDTDRRDDWDRCWHEGMYMYHE